MFHFPTKIHAIKAVKELPFLIEDVTSNNGVVHKCIRVSMGLKDAKDFVEAIMAIEPISTIRYDNLQEELNNLQKEYNTLQERYWKLRDAISGAIHSTD